ncbi:hypothetical protein [Chitinophaga rhizosphaerae]|uniref:hypothetical protein n=1 Tax=Chitinophaga rhizosphaerae TaxID=1864947 RepID=UPI000F7FBB12|nr:hypothetical protein [Chitinophaga rhizosphaerae]
MSLHYQHYRHATAHGLDAADVERACFSVVMHYLYMYNKWRKMYPKLANLDVSFKEEDFENPGTYDTISPYFKKKYPRNWAEKLGLLVGKTVEEVNRYEARRQLYYNK